MKFVIKRTRNKQFRVTIVAKNGEVLFTSETYTRKAKAYKVINLLVDTIDDEEDIIVIEEEKAK